MRMGKDKPIIIIENLHTHDDRVGGGTMAEKKLSERIVQSSIDYHNKWIERKSCRSFRLPDVCGLHDMIMLMAMMMYKGGRRVRSALSR